MSTYPFQRILCPVDFSHHSRNALSLAVNLTSTFDAELHSLAVIEDFLPAVPLDPSGLYGLPPDYDAKIKTAVEKELETLLLSLNTSHRLVPAVKSGTPTAEIIRYVRQFQIDVIVMGTHGRSGLAHVVMGSVAESVLRAAPCPVMVVPKPGHHYAPL